MIRLEIKCVAWRAALATTISLAAAAAVPGPRAWADTPDAEANTSLEAIIVTANRREENLQNVPISIVAVTADSAAQMGITDASSLASSVPGLLFNRQSNASIPFLRGVGNPTGESGDEPSVAMYVDDVYMPAGAASLSNFASLESIEVEKGPQGTLFGRNATGGVIQVRTRDPSQTPAFDVTYGYANYNTTSSSLYASGPLTSTLSANISLYQSNQQDGWGRNFATGDPAYTGWDNGGRVKLLWQPTDKFSALLAGDLDVTKTDEGVVYNQWPGTTALGLNFATGAPTPISPPTGYYNYNNAIDGRSLEKHYGVSLKMTADFDWSKLVSISAARDNNTFYQDSYDPVPQPLAITPITEPERTFTQEFRLLSPEGQKWSWIVGMFYFKDRAGFEPLDFEGLLLATPPVLRTEDYGIEHTTSFAGFGQTTYPILPDTNLTVGFRYTRDKRELAAGYKVVTGAGGTYTQDPNSPQNDTWSKPTFRASLDHSFTPDIMAYVAFNRGFKSGLFNPVVNPGSPIGAPVAPEVLDSYTAGAKTEFFDHRLRTNAEFFYYKYKNIQVDEVNGTATFLTNAAAATIKGLDLDVTAEPIQNLTVTATIEVLDGHYDNFPDGQYWVYTPFGNCAFAVGNTCGLAPGSPYLPPGYKAATGNWNLGGNHTIQSPPFSSTLTLNYLLPTTIGNLDFSANWNHTGNYYADADNGGGQVPPSRSGNDEQALLNLYNASVSWATNDKHWNVRLWGKNLSGVKYWSFALEDGFNTQYSPSPPRTYGVTFGWHW